MKRITAAIPGRWTVTALLAAIAVLGAAGTAYDAARAALAGADGPPRPDEAARLVAVVADPNSEWQEREAAEAALAELPADRVLPLLVPRMGRRPPGPIHPPAPTAAADKDGPADWLAYYSVRRVWAEQTDADKAERERKAGGPALGRLLVDLLPLAATPSARLDVVRAMGEHWTDAAEDPLARVFRDAGENPESRAAAAAALLARRKGRYYAEVRGTAGAAGPALRERLFEVLVEVRPPGPAGQPGAAATADAADPVVVLMGFELMERQCRTAGDDAAGGDTARRLGAYLGEKFSPDPSDFKDRGAGRGGRAEDAEATYGRDTVAGARRWWAGHGKQIESQVAKLHPGAA